ncbi:MAG: hypothetical protein KF900_06945 [Bacteroidetes bacterium]|nr:hypothetical protein [Bacteroidota bacterium]
MIIDLNKINLPLSEADYKKLLDWRDEGLISWLDFPDKLSKGLKEYDKTHEGAEWELISETPTD